MSDIDNQCPVGMEVYTILLPKSKYTKSKARKWLADHGKKFGRIKDGGDFWHAKQRAHSRYVKGSDRTIVFPNTSGIKARIACPKKERAKQKYKEAKARAKNIRAKDVIRGNF